MFYWICSSVAGNTNDKTWTPTFDRNFRKKDEFVRVPNNSPIHLLQNSEGEISKLFIYCANLFVWHFHFLLWKILSSYFKKIIFNCFVLLRLAINFDKIKLIPRLRIRPEPIIEFLKSKSNRTMKSEKIRWWTNRFINMFKIS